MDVTQTHIKINQTSKSDEIKSKSITQIDDPINSFNEILAMYNFVGQSHESVGESAEPHVHKGSNEIGSDRSDSRHLSEEDGYELESILSLLVAEIQKVQHSSAILQLSPVNNSLAGDSQPPGGLTIFYQLQQVNEDSSKALAQWLQKVEGPNQTSTADQNPLIEKLKQLMGESNKEYTIGGRIPSNGQFYENGLSIDASLKPNPGLSLDKNQVILTHQQTIDKSQLFERIAQLIGKLELIESQPTTKTSNEIQADSEIFGDLLSEPVVELMKSNGQPPMVNNHQQGTDAWNVPKAVTPAPILSVSDFVPEVNEWIGRYMRITNNQFGSAEARFSLYPEHLGHIEIKISSQQGLLFAQIVTETSLAKETLEGQLQHLRQALQQQGLVVQKLEILQLTPASTDMNQANLSFSHGDSSSSNEQQSFSSDQDVFMDQKETVEKETERENLSITYGGAAPKLASQIDFTA